MKTTNVNQNKLAVYLLLNTVQGDLMSFSILDVATRMAMGKLFGAQPQKPPAAKPIIVDAQGTINKEDLRVKIRVPASYLVNLTQGDPKQPLGIMRSIIFPYTPNISFDYKADYTPQQPLHSNFTLNFYKSSSVTPISITGKFTVQNDADAEVYLGTLHLLRALTKMRTGGPTGDKNSGAPPPICRLDAYGDFMMANVPVAIGGFKVELPEGVDYFTSGTGVNNRSPYGQAFVPTVSTISITCIPMYSREEMQKFSVTGWLNDRAVRMSGIL
jgi:hypothetical protein